MRHLAQGLGRGRRVAVAPGHGQGHARQDLAPVPPGVEARVLILTDDEEAFGLRMLGGEFAHRVDGVGDAPPTQLSLVDHEARLPGGDQPHHLETVPRIGQASPGLLPGLASGHPQQHVERQHLQRQVGQRAVRPVWRVKAATQQADAAPVRRRRQRLPEVAGLDARAAQAQSRGRRKSLYRRASGVPGSGFQA